MPVPNPNEKHDDYISRCMSSEEMKRKYPDSDQRYAVCESIWKTEGELDAQQIPSSTD